MPNNILVTSYPIFFSFLQEREAKAVILVGTLLQGWEVFPKYKDTPFTLTAGALKL